MSTSTPLDVLQIANPCPAAWDAMAGDARGRFCEHCQKHVVNISAMPRDEAERLVCSNAGGLCVRVERDLDGVTLTLDYAPTPRRISWWWWLGGGGGLATTLAIAAAIHAARSPRPIGTTVMMGDISPAAASRQPGQGTCVTPPAPSGGTLAEAPPERSEDVP